MGAFINPTLSIADEEVDLLADEVALGAPGTIEETVVKEPKLRKIKVSESGKAEKAAKIAIEKSRKPAKAKIKKHRRKRK